MEKVQVSRDVQRQELMVQIIKKHGETEVEDNRTADQLVDLDEIEKELNEAVV